MDIRNCTRCGKIYAYDGFKICMSCRRDDEKDFQKVKEYLNEYPGANINEVSEKTEVDSRKIIGFLKEGRLEVTDESNIVLTCERCGESIRTGRFCEKCTLEMKREFKNSIGGGRSPRDLKSGRVTEKIRIVDKYRRK